MNAWLYFVHCLTPVHVGTGQGVGIIDMPLMREKITQWPMLPGSSIKGVHREHLRQTPGIDEAWLDAAFGRAESSGEEGAAGSLVLSDSRLLAFPVASLYGTFAYVTCPMALRRMLRDMAAAGMMPTEALFVDDLDKLLTAESDQKPSGQQKEGDVPKDRALVVSGGSALTSGDMLYLDEFECKAIESDALEKWASWLEAALFAHDESFGRLFRERLTVVSDEAFQYFVTVCCEVVPRIRLEQERKTVQRGALWYEEYLPAEAILYGISWCDNIHGRSGGTSRDDLLKQLPEKLWVQVGANATVGKGRVCLSHYKGGRS
ncbi:type III-B CRISPR module RAMP protein Cmr4 [Paenibacillus sp. y28]|uniref:type III-B CRISPR module RAMP protein Cmr4 n=1 Tax=Paenibacillus sp. y28 TaxID=3129110 RepID=UPI00301B60A8